MIAIIARKEFIDMIRDARYRLSAAVVLALLLGALVTGFAARQSYERQRADAVRAERQAWVNQGKANPHSAAHFGRYAFKPLPLAALIDQGLNPYLGVAVYIEGHAQNPFRYRPVEDSTGLRQFGELTAAGVLQFLLPLVLVLLTFNAFAGEREQGTLKQLLSLGVSPARLLAGKALGVTAALATLVIPASLLGLALLSGGMREEGTQEPVRLAALALAYLIYLFIFVALSLGVSARAASARMALLMLLGFWVFTTLLVPRASATLAEMLHPTPTLPEFLKQVDEDMKQGVDGHRPPGEREEELRQAVLKKYNVTSEKDLPINFTGLVLQESEEHGNAVYDKRFGELREIYQRQTGILRKASAVSPLMAVRSLSMALAGTDLWHHETFADAAEAYRRKWVKRLNDDLTYNSRTGDFTYAVGREFWEATEDFKYTPPPLDDAMLTQGWSGLVLLAWLCAALLFAGLSMRRIAAVEGA
jgi:ABC-2 type transport system permease protein